MATEAARANKPLTVNDPRIDLVGEPSPHRRNEHGHRGTRCDQGTDRRRRGIRQELGIRHREKHPASHDQECDKDGQISSDHVPAKDGSEIDQGLRRVPLNAYEPHPQQEGQRDNTGLAPAAA